MHLPLFPLGTVLFPGMLLPLHVFEQRYRALVRRCLSEDRPFGVTLIRSGSEVGPPADPHRVGTTARIVHAEGLPDGRFEILARGEQRFAIDALVTSDEPYLVGDIRHLDEVGGEGVAELAQRVPALFSEYLLARAATAGGPLSAPSASSPLELSYLVAANLAIDLTEQQQLLELPSAAARLEAEVRLIEREVGLLKDLLVRQNARGAGPRQN